MKRKPKVKTCKCGNVDYKELSKLCMLQHDHLNKQDIIIVNIHKELERYKKAYSELKNICKIN
tara:strand:- start:107 stop:295 length:189 start_codon:yes stop_codon:yes gene_type:complete